MSCFYVAIQPKRHKVLANLLQARRNLIYMLLQRPYSQPYSVLVIERAWAILILIVNKPLPLKIKLSN